MLKVYVTDPSEYFFRFLEHRTSNFCWVLCDVISLMKTINLSGRQNYP